MIDGRAILIRLASRALHKRILGVAIIMAVIFSLLFIVYLSFLLIWAQQDEIKRLKKKLGVLKNAKRNKTKV